MDGIFIGAAYGRALRNGMILSFGVFATALYLLEKTSFISGVEAVLFAFILYLITRGLSLIVKLPDITR